MNTKEGGFVPQILTGTTGTGTLFVCVYLKSQYLNYFFLPSPFLPYIAYISNY